MNHGDFHNVTDIYTTPSHSEAIMDREGKRNGASIKADISNSLVQRSRQINSRALWTETITHLHLEGALCKYFDGL